MTKLFGMALLALVQLLFAFVASAQEAGSAKTFVKSGSLSTNSAIDEESAALPRRAPQYRLRTGDTLSLDFDLSPEFNATVTVGPDGNVVMKGVGSVDVAGKTVPEVTQTVMLAYKKILHEPNIAISLKDFEKPYFIASGQVGKPGKYDLRTDLTLTEAVALAGGFTSKAKDTQVVLFRPLPAGGYEAKVLNVKKSLKARDLSEDPPLQPGDLLYVPQNIFSSMRPFLPTTNLGVYAQPGIF